MIVDWEMPRPNGPEFVRTVRSPETFPLPHVPIIMLTGHGERSRVEDAVNLGVNEFLLKPVLTKALMGRLISLIAKSAPHDEDGRLLRARTASAVEFQAGNRGGVALARMSRPLVNETLTTSAAAGGAALPTRKASHGLMRATNA